MLQFHQLGNNKEKNMFYNKELNIIKTRQEFTKEGMFIPADESSCPEGWFRLINGAIPEYDNEFYSLRHTEPVQVGDHFVWGFETFISVDLEEAKVIQSKRINRAREQARIDEGAEYDNDLFDIDEKSQANITAIVSMLIANNVPDTYKSVYRSKTNSDHELTKLQMVQLGTVIRAKVSEIYQKSWDLKEQVDKATNKEEVEAITW